MPAAAAELETLSVETTDGVCVITFNRPDSLNAINDGFTSELAAALRSAEKDANVRVVVLTGAGRAFSSGQDLGDLKAKYVPGHVPALGDDLRHRYDPIVKKLRSMEKPVIAAVNGVAAGAGCSLALACDMRIASEHAAFIEVFVHVGLVPDSGSTWTLPRLVGLARAMELCCTGRKVGAEEAERIGLVNRVVPADELMTATMKLAGQLANLPCRAIGLTKRLLAVGYGDVRCFAGGLDEWKLRGYALETSPPPDDQASSDAPPTLPPPTPR